MRRRSDPPMIWLILSRVLLALGVVATLATINLFLLNMLER